MLTHLLDLLARLGYAPATQRQYGRHLRHFAEWCTAASCTAWPASSGVIASYIRSLAPHQRARVQALDAVHRGSGLGSLRDVQLIEDALIANGMLSRRSPSPVLRAADRLTAGTRQIYQRRIQAFRRWCLNQQVKPVWASVKAWLASSARTRATRSQYRAALRHWDALDPPARVSRTASPSTPAATPAPIRRPRRPLTLRTPEQRLLYQLGRTGVAEHHRHARGFARVDEKRLRAMVRRGYLQVHTGVARPRDGEGAHTVRYYSLGDRGRRWLKRQMPGHLYRWNPQQLNHDLHLTDVYWQLPPAVQRTWQCESELIAHLRQGGQFATGEAVDAAVVINGQPYAIEVAIGYKRADIAKKQAFIADVFNGRGMVIQ